MSSGLVLGIDPGSRVTGYALLERQGRSYVALRCDVIRLDKIEDHAQRLQKLFMTLKDLVQSFEPEQCAVETPVFGKDPQAMLKLGRAQAACMLAFTSSGYEVQEYLPKEVKKAVTGNGNASKEQVAYVLSKTVKLPEDQPLKKDATDALAVAWCHMHRSGLMVPKTSTYRHQNNRKDAWHHFLDKHPERVKK